ncbi:hypothetical protein BU16DRAFT_480983 [Lophium mytilinum]|uniref:TIM-barrel domain-containing protein n=1 Tax=Lophium mytilinum TaxID=390894 RepID=A0A6A6R1H3_9PEZI|nr:hypothetical protein BU16DRAFT_480983 [Lophium mytilinum]
MPPPTDRAEIMARLRKQVAEGKAIVGAGAGIGLTAKSVEAGGGDLIVIYNSGRYRMNGRGSLAGLMPYGNANDIVLEMANETLPLLTTTPLLCGVCATDPTRPLPPFLRQLQALGIAGIQNFPTVGLIDGTFRQALEATGMSYAAEVSLIALAHGMGFLTTPYVFDAAQAKDMAEAGADVVVAHMGLTTGGTIGLGKEGMGAKTLDECVSLCKEILAAVRGVQGESAMVIVHGGPVEGAEEAQYVLERVPGLCGFYGASSVERIPVEKAIRGTVEGLKAVGIRKFEV